MVLLLILEKFTMSSCVLPLYTPAVVNDIISMDRNELVRNYFLQDYTNAEIVGFLALQHGIVISIRTVKRILKQLNLRRARSEESSIEKIIDAILQEFETSCGTFLGYRQLTQRLRQKYGLNVKRDSVMRYMRIVDPDGVDRRKRRRLKRRRYVTPGPNFLWHIDGWDKLAPFGLYVHGAIDGYSRRILWLEVNSTNKNAKVVASHYLNTVEQLGGVPTRLRSDKGTENSGIGILQQFFRWHNEDEFSARKSFHQGKSSANQRIEAWWSKLRDGGGGWWINMFKDLRDSGIYEDGDNLLDECVKFCFLPILRKELQLVAELWNTHKIQGQKRHEVEGGKPDIMFFMPRAYNTNNYLHKVDIEDVRACKMLYTEKCVDVNENMEELVRLMKPNYEPPSNASQALLLFIEIAQLLQNY